MTAESEPEYEKHNVSTDALDTLGSIIGPDEKRDAIHLAVYPVEAAEMFHPGMHVKLGEDGKAYRVYGTGDGVGICDPFLDSIVAVGQRFWLVVYPRQISSLRHVWEHPAFPASGETDAPVNQADKAASELWLRKFISENDLPSFDAVVAASTGAPLEEYDDYGAAYTLDDFGDGESYITFHGRDAHCNVGPEFWKHMAIFTGKPVFDKVNYFSCSC